MLKNPRTTIVGVLMIVISALTLFGVVKAEDQLDVQQLVTGVVEAIFGLIAIFKAKDASGYNNA